MTHKTGESRSSLGFMPSWLLKDITPISALFPSPSFASLCVLTSLSSMANGHSPYSWEEAGFQQISPNVCMTLQRIFWLVLFGSQVLTSTIYWASEPKGWGGEARSVDSTPGSHVTEEESWGKEWVLQSREWEGFWRKKKTPPTKVLLYYFCEIMSLNTDPEKENMGFLGWLLFSKTP